MPSERRARTTHRNCCNRRGQRSWPSSHKQVDAGRDHAPDRERHVLSDFDGLVDLVGREQVGDVVVVVQAFDDEAAVEQGQDDTMLPGF